MEINERIIQIKGDRIATESTLELGQDVVLYVRATVKSITHEDNDDGTQDLVYHLKGVLAEKVQDILD